MTEVLYPMSRVQEQIRYVFEVKPPFKGLDEASGSVQTKRRVVHQYCRLLSAKRRFRCSNATKTSGVLAKSRQAIEGSHQSGVVVPSPL